MIYLYYKDRLEEIKWTSKYDYLVTRFKIGYYFGKIPENVKDNYLTDKGVELTRVFMQRLHEGNFYYKVEKKNEWGNKCYDYYFGLDSLDKQHPFLSSCGTTKKLRYVDTYWLKHFVENAVGHYIGEGEVIAGILLGDNKFKLINREDVWVYVDLSYTYLSTALDTIRPLLRKKFVDSVLWANRSIVEVNDEPVKVIIRGSK